LTSDLNAPIACGSYAEAAARSAANNAAARATRRRIEQREGGLEDFLLRIRVEHIGTPAAGGLEDFHAVLRASILPDELVPIEDFIAALGPKNEDRALQNAIGPYRYIGLAVRSPSEGTVGAAGFAVFCHPSGPATVHGSYYALLPRFRGLGLHRLMVNAVAQNAVRFVARVRPSAFNAGPMVQFIEANGIANMTLRDRLLDQAIAVHPLARDAIWERMGFREILSIHYHQRGSPPLELALKAALIDVDNLGGLSRALGLGAPTAVAGDVLLRHVSAFDNLLMNYDEASRALSRRERLPDPRDAGLLARFDPSTALPVLTPDAAARERFQWAAIDKRLANCSDLNLSRTMRELRDVIEGGGPGVSSRW
jgi:GNAT superfamily N-acetyltransferase